MFPKIDTLTGIGAAPVPHEADRAAETYRSTQAAEPKAEGPEGKDSFQPSSRCGTEVVIAGRNGQDQAVLSFRLTPDEREVFTAVFSGGQDPRTLTGKERDALQEGAERISSYIDEAAARHSDQRERVEKAVSEWYSRMTRGEQAPLDLIDLLRRAAAGDLDSLVG